MQILLILAIAAIGAVTAVSIFGMLLIKAVFDRLIDEYER